MPVSIEDLLGRVKRPVRSVFVCLDGELWSQHDKLSREIGAAVRDTQGKMGEPSELGELRDELRRVEDAMRAAEVEFRFSGVSTFVMEDIQKKFPGKGAGTMSSEGCAALIAASAVDPEMTHEQAKKFCESISDGQFTKLLNGALMAAQGSADVPFSVRASATTSGTGSR